MTTTKLLLSNALYPLLFVILLFVVHITAQELDLNLTTWGVYPKTITGLRGIFFSPLIHGSYNHLFNNSIPLLVLGWALFQFYRPLAFKTFFSLYFIAGIWLWVAGRPSYHIGASGVVYGLASFLFLSGWLRKEKKVMALSFLVVFLYGSMWWGVLPVDPHISWEGHLWGAIAGFVLAFYYRRQGPQKPQYQWERDEQLEEAQKQWEEAHGLRESAEKAEDNITVNQEQQKADNQVIRYYYTEKPKNQE